MTKQTIPVTSGDSFQRFSIELSGDIVEFRLSWVTLGGYFLVDLSVDGEAITKGRALWPEIDLLSGLNTKYGKIYLEGEQATPDNLGASNTLIYET